MKQLNLFCMMCVIAAVALACSGKKQEAHEHEHDTAADEWKEMDNFHTLMADAFHPYKEDSTNLTPAKQKAEALAIAAEQWKNAPLPEKVNNDETKAALAQLSTDAVAFASISKSADDNATGEALNKLHDEFHHIQEMWYGGHGHEHQH
jgi:hypothetical protein